MFMSNSCHVNYAYIHVNGIRIIQYREYYVSLCDDELKTICVYKFVSILIEKYMHDIFSFKILEITLCVV